MSLSCYWTKEILWINRFILLALMENQQPTFRTKAIGIASKVTKADSLNSSGLCMYRHS